ncbi:MAG: hypothetical protein ACYDCA_06500 [Candidatus Tyrphobacter sp.]
MASALLALQLLSPSFASLGRLPEWTAHGDARCPGSDRSPELHWLRVPLAARSYGVRRSPTASA